MERYSTEEQQIEAIQSFLKKHGVSMVAGVVIGLGLFIGWKHYSEQQLLDQQAQSLAYSQAMEKISAEQGFAEVQNFISEYGDTEYAALAALQLANKAIGSADYAEAEKQLSQVEKLASEPSIKDLALLRLARVQQQQEKYDEALMSLESIGTEAYAARAQEVKGDIYQKTGNYDQARLAYTQALDESNPGQLVQVKLDNLAVAGDIQ